MKLTRLAPLLIAALLPLACSAADDSAAGSAYKLGKHYQAARTASPDPNPELPDVTEIFWYGCPHCYKLEPKVDHWVTNDKPADVNFTRIPASLGRPVGILHSKAFFTAQALGILDEFHPRMFKLIHEERRHITSQRVLQTLFGEHGVDEGTFNSTFNSFIIENKVQQAEATIRALGITGVPAMAVDNQYHTSVGMAGGEEALFKVVDALVEKSRK